MTKALLVGSFFALSSLNAMAKLEILSAIKAESDIPAWNESYADKVAAMKSSNTYPENGYTECRPVVEVSSSFLCLSNTQRGMNNTLGRASFFIEGIGGNNSKGTLVTQDDGTYESYKSMIGGHDLKGQDLLRFNDVVEQKCAQSNNDANICYNPYEKDMFENLILPYAKKMPNFVVITFASQSGMSWQDVVTHEIMHAQYFNQPVFQKIVDEFWAKDVSEEDRQAIRNKLGQNYDSSDEFLMKNEFQAYILMAGAEYSELRYFIGKYREPLMKRLLDNGVTPIQIKQ